MPRISDLTRVNEVSDGDVFPIEQASSGRTRSVAFKTIRDDISADVDAAVSIAVAAAAAAEQAAASSDAQVLRGDLADGATALKGADLVAYVAGETVRDAIAASKQFDADLSNASDPAKGAAMVGRGVVAVDSIADLLSIPALDRKETSSYLVKGSVFGWDGSNFTPVGRVSVDAFGADPTGSSYSDAAIDAAIKSGWPLDWRDGTYTVSGEVGGNAVIDHPIDWISSGASVTLDPLASHVATVISYSVKAYSHSIKGKMTIDGSLKANIALNLRNQLPDVYPDNYATLTADGLNTINCKRDVSFRLGSGLVIEGAFLSIVLNNPTVDNIRLPAGAGTTGVVGVSGILLTRDSTAGTFPLTVHINNPQISNIESEDLNYKDDQDGIVIFGGLDASDMWSTFEISGGRFENCFGRSIKSQASYGKVTGSHFVRNRGPNSGGNEEISAQNGSVDTEGLTFDYRGHVPSSFISERVGAQNKGPARVAGIKGTVTGATLPNILSTFSEQGIQRIDLSGVGVTGPMTRLVEYLTPNIGAELVVGDITVDNISEELVRVRSGGISPAVGPSANVSIGRVENRGSVKPLLRHLVSGTSARATLSCSGGVIGFTGADFISSGSINPKIVKRIEPMSGKYNDGGFIDMAAVTISAGATATLANNSTLGGCAVEILARLDKNAFCKLVVSSSGTVTVFKGSAFAVGNTTEPAVTTESFSVWSSGANLFIKNNNASARVVTVLYLSA